MSFPFFFSYASLTEAQDWLADWMAFKKFCFLFLQTVRHGFPYQPSSMAFDPVQKILAVGTQTGALRL